MRTSRLKLVYPLLALILLGGVGAAAPAHSQAAKPGGNQFTKTLVSDLTASGLEVTQGYPRLWTMDDCKDGYPVTFNCYGNNPASPYVVSAVKPWPDEFVDPATADAYGRVRPGYSTTYRLDPREAIVLFGTMPPPGKYMSLQSYVFTHEWVVEEGDPDHHFGYPWITDAEQGGRDKFSRSPMVGYLFSTLPRNPERVQSFSSVGNSINNVVMDGDQSGASFGELRYFVMTPDQAMEEKVRAALGSLGVPQDAVFTERIPSSFDGTPLGPLGLDEEALDFMHGFRYAMPEDEHAAQAWRAKLPLTVLRVREAPSSNRPAEPYDDIPRDERTAENEADLREDLQDLATAVTTRATQGPWNLVPLPAPSMGEPPEMANVETWLGHFGPHCRTIGENCLGDGQDASYFFMPPQPIDSGQVYAVVGTLGTQTGNATYNGLSINDASLLKGVANVPDHDEDSPASDLEGSADGYAGTVANTDKFFVHYFTRDCDAIDGLADGACTTITEKMVPLMTDVSAPGDPHLHGFFTAGLRSYVKPGTERGPTTDYDAEGKYESGQLPPTVLAFTIAPQ
ncbi:hypothetical protein [Agromyces sp. H66]|uniref:hypothetical protein n=1 Tax=Agromyces sp. H66 TaxID=2529859 RepID=UPI0010AA08E7|nr:hypothetical protein [Agromyces sp. H66]